MLWLLSRASGLVCIIAGLVLYFLIIPAQIEVGEPALILPDTLPNAMALAMAFAGILILFESGEDHKADFRLLLRTFLFLAVLVVAFFLINQIGLLWTAPIMGGVIMILAHERRPVWILVGTVLVPFFMWLLFEVLLGRVLP